MGNMVGNGILMDFQSVFFFGNSMELGILLMDFERKQPGSY